MKEIQEAKTVVEKWQRKYRGVDDYAAEVHLKVKKQWQEESEKQLAIKMKEESGKLEATMKKQKERIGAERTKRKEEKVKPNGREVRMEDSPAIPPKKGKEKDKAPEASKTQLPLRPRKNPTGLFPPVKNRKATKPAGNQYASFL